MQVRQLVTVLGLCLSRVHAIPLVDPNTEVTIRSIVQLITTPHEALEKDTFQLSNDQIRNVKENPYLFSHQIVAGLGEAHNSLAYLARGEDAKISNLIGRSILSYTHTILVELPDDVRKRRLVVLRDSLYSRILDFFQRVGPETWHDKAPVAVGNLENELKQAVLKLTKVHVTPAGDKNILEKIRTITAKFQEDHKTILEKMSQMETHMITHLPSHYELKPMEYRSVAQVEDALKETNAAHIPEAMPVDYVIHEHPVSEKGSPAASHDHHAIHAQPPANPAQVAATA